MTVSEPGMCILHEVALCGFRSVSGAETLIDQKSEIDDVMNLHHPCGNGERLVNVIKTMEI